jgi:hypothetical protein
MGDAEVHLCVLEGGPRLMRMNPRPGEYGLGSASSRAASAAFRAPFVWRLQHQGARPDDLKVDLPVRGPRPPSVHLDSRRATKRRGLKIEMMRGDTRVTGFCFAGERRSDNVVQIGVGDRQRTPAVLRAHLIGRCQPGWASTRQSADPRKIRSVGTRRYLSLRGHNNWRRTP